MAEESPEPAKALTKNPLGPTGKAVSANVERLRRDQNLTFAALSERLEALKRPIPTLGLRKIVAGTRRVDADDLVGLAAALGVSPSTLLLPQTESGHDEVAVTGVNYQVPAMTLWLWLLAELPMKGDDRIPMAFQIAARPTWWWRYQAGKEAENESARRAADRNLVESGFMSASELLDWKPEVSDGDH